MLFLSQKHCAQNAISSCKCILSVVSIDMIVVRAWQDARVSAAAILGTAKQVLLLYVLILAITARASQKPTLYEALALVSASPSAPRH